MASLAWLSHGRRPSHWRGQARLRLLHTIQRGPIDRSGPPSPTISCSAVNHLPCCPPAPGRQHTSSPADLGWRGVLSRRVCALYLYIVQYACSTQQGFAAAGAGVASSLQAAPFIFTSYINLDLPPPDPQGLVSISTPSDQHLITSVFTAPPRSHTARPSPPRTTTTTARGQRSSRLPRLRQPRAAVDIYMSPCRRGLQTAV